MTTRKSISLKTKLASALLMLTGPDGRDIIPYQDSKQMSADQIISLFAFDHWPIRKADGGSDHPSNLTPRLIAAHREKTAKVDVPEMAKSKRIRRKVEEHERRLLRSAVEHILGPMPKRRIPSRPFPNKKRKFANSNGNKI